MSHGVASRLENPPGHSNAHGAERTRQAEPDAGHREADAAAAATEARRADAEPREAARARPLTRREPGRGRVSPGSRSHSAYTTRRSPVVRSRTSINPTTP